MQEQTLAQLLAEPDSGIDFSRVVHGAQRFTSTRPIVAGDAITFVERRFRNDASIDGESVAVLPRPVAGNDGARHAGP